MESQLGTTKLIGQEMVEQGLLTPEQLDQILESQPRHKQFLGEIAVHFGFISEQEMAKFIAQYFHLPYAELKDEQEIEVSALDLIPENLARRYRLVAIQKKDDLLTVAMVDPLDIRAIDAVRLETNCRVRKVVASRNGILKAIDRYYHTPLRLAKSMDHLAAGEAPVDQELEFQTGREVNAQLDQLKHEASDAPVVQFVNLLLMRAVQERASDIHIEPEEYSITIRLRVDGQLREVTAPPKHMSQVITTRVKLLGNLDIAERRLPQDGRFKFKVFDKTIDVRMSCLPTVYGEKIVMRILDRGALILDMQSLGLEFSLLENFRRVLKLPHGLIILTGPTGSGKTTTLYAALNAIKTPTKNIVTIEDPVEYQLEKINQVQTKSEIGLTFAAGLRSILRQDPDVVMVGEIRDRETADICIRSSLTGHMVLSTLHTNDAVSAVSRLKDMGIEPYLLAATLNMVMAQRLVRRICQECSAPWQPPQDLIRRLELTKVKNDHWNFRRGRGCARCGDSGYLGRIAVYEQFLITEKMRGLIAEGAPLQQIQYQARQEGLKTLFESALTKVAEGITTLDEALSVCATQAETLE